MSVTGVPRTRRQHRLVTTGLGVGGLTAMKALKHAQVNITDALVFLTRFAAMGATDVTGKTSLWLQLTAGAAVSTTVGMLTALYIAIPRRPTASPDTERAA